MKKWQTLKIRKYTEGGYETLVLGQLFWFRPGTYWNPPPAVVEKSAKQSGNDLIRFQTRGTA